VKSPRLRRSPQAARENILAAAEAILTEQGPQAIKLADVAAAAGVANATVLHHFGSIDGVEAALMERMIAHLVERVLAIGADDPAVSRETALQTLFDAFETRGAVRLAAWLEMTGEAARMTSVRAAVRAVVSKRMVHAGLTPAKAENLVLVSVLMAMGVGLFGRTLSTLLGKPPGRARQLAIELLKQQEAALR
jgi:AcrR family transcriptional regulator